MDKGSVDFYDFEEKNNDIIEESLGLIETSVIAYKSQEIKGAECDAKKVYICEIESSDDKIRPTEQLVSKFETKIDEIKDAEKGVLSVYTIQYSDEEKCGFICKSDGAQEVKDINDKIAARLFREEKYCETFQKEGEDYSITREFDRDNENPEIIEDDVIENCAIVCQ